MFLLGLTLNSFREGFTRLMGKQYDPSRKGVAVHNTINHSIRRGGQARHIIIDARSSGLTKVEAVRGLIRARNLTRGMIDTVRIIGDAFDLVSIDFR